MITMDMVVSWSATVVEDLVTPTPARVDVLPAGEVEIVMMVSGHGNIHLT